MTPTQIDLTGLDINITATVRGGTRRLNLRDPSGPLDLTGVASFDGEILPSKSATIGSGTAISWSVVDAPAGGVACTIPAGVDLGGQWCYVSAVVDGSTLEISGTLRINEF